MSQNFHSLVPELKSRIKEECVRETPQDSDELIGLPYPYVISGKGKSEALYYWDTYFINLGLLRMRMIDYARHNVEDLVFLLRKFGHVPASNSRDMLGYSQPPFLPWMVRDIYRATGEKEWLRRMLPDVVHEFKFWTSKPHTTPTGLYRYHPARDGALSPEESAMAESGWIASPRFADPRRFNAIDLNALLSRNARMIYDLQVEAEGRGDDTLLQKAAGLKKMMEFCWDDTAGFYYDNNFEDKKLSPVRSLAGFMPLFVEMVDNDRAQRIVGHLKDFCTPGGFALTDQNYGVKRSLWSAPLIQAPYVYTTLKGLCDYDFMEDAADIGTNWLSMVHENYGKTGELWAWYNAADRSTQHPDGLENSPMLSLTAGVYAEVIDCLGLD
ncbi:MAG TPA: trehalase family glycosidase [bacterium]|nr:trehalase family glycosidase [bacterium]HPR86913.1 trehalase family glycosidase [bacterium]